MDCKSLNFVEGDLLQLYNEQTGNTVYCIAYVSPDIPVDSIALGINLIKNLGVSEYEFIEVSVCSSPINEVSDIIVEYDSQDYDPNILTFDENFRINMIQFLNNYYFNHVMFLYWPDKNANLKIILKNVDTQKPPFKITQYYDKISLKIVPKNVGIPFNAIILIDCSGSMKRRDIKFMNMENAIDNLITIYNGSTTSHITINKYLNNLKPKFIIDRDNYKIRRIDATFIAILLFFNQKISRGLGEKCGVILYSGKSKSFNFQNDKTIFDSNDFTNIDIIYHLFQEMENPKNLATNQTLFSPAIDELKSRIKRFSKISSNPILILFLTDGQPEPKHYDPPDKIIKKIDEVMDLAKQIDKQIVVYTIGIGEIGQVDNDLLLKIAEHGNGEYHFTKTFTELTEWFENLANNFSITLRKF
ncbi:MAG: VWA domain-containing protein [Candidatus Helarchaeota archaeon]